jgi:hypothetical protein
MTDTTITITIDADPAEILGGGADWSPELYVELLDDRALIKATMEHSAHNGTPMDVWHGLRHVWSNRLSQGSLVVADVDGIHALAERLRPYLARVAAGHSVEWDGSNHVGRLTDDAREASETIADILCGAGWEWTDGSVTVWHAGEWLSGASLGDFGLATDSTDGDIEAAAKVAEARACADSARLFGDVAAALREMRDEAREEASTDD